VLTRPSQPSSTRPIASATDAGPSTVVSVIAFGSDDHQLVQPGGSGERVAVDRGPAVAQQDRHLAAGPAAPQLLGRPQQRAGQVGRAEAAQGEHIGDHPFTRLGEVLALRRHHVLAEREHAVVRRRSPGNRCCRHRRGGERLAAHRATAVDQQAQRRARLGPAAHAQPLDVEPVADRGRRITRTTCSSSTTCLDDRLHARIDVEVATVGPVGLLDELADAARPARPTSGDVEEQPPGEPPGEVAQCHIGGAGEIGEHRQGLVRVVLHRLVEGSFVELAHLGRDLLEARVARQLAPRGRLALRLLHGLVGLVALFGAWRLPQRELLAPVGAPAFPSASPAPTRPKISSHSSVTIPSAVRVEPSRTRIRPDRATIAASRPTLG
jgi:hypothetical protein